MTFAEVYETIPGDGWLSQDEAELLWDAVGKTLGPILEVGCYRGRSTVLLAGTGRLVYAVDPFAGFSTEDRTGDDTRRAFVANVVGRGIVLTGAQGDRLRVTLTNGPKKGLVELFPVRVEDWTPRPVGFAYLDGDHTYAGTLAQIDKALACRPTGIGVHDVNDSGGGMAIKRACLERLGQWTRRVQRLAVWDGL